MRVSADEALKEVHAIMETAKELWFRSSHHELAFVWCASHLIMRANISVQEAISRARDEALRQEWGTLRAG